MRISVSGSFSTGKTTLISIAAETVKRTSSLELTVISEVARGVIAKGYPLDREATVPSYLNYALDQLAAERTVRSRDHVLSDRSLIDLLAYIRVNANDSIPKYVDRLIEELVWIETNYFDYYCYLPVEFPPIDDGVRCTDSKYQALVDEELKNLFVEFQLCPIRLSGNATDRVRELLAIPGFFDHVARD